MARPPWSNDLFGFFRGLSRIGSAAAEIRTEEVSKAWATSSLRPMVAKGASSLQETITKALQDPQMLQANVSKTTTETLSRISLVAEGIKAYRTQTLPISQTNFSEGAQEVYDPLYDPNIQELSIEDIMLHEAMSGHEDHAVSPGGEPGVEILAGIGEITDAAATNIGQVKSTVSTRLEGFEPLLDASQYRESEITEEHVQALQNKIQEMEGAAFGYNNVGSFKDVGSTELVDEIVDDGAGRVDSVELASSNALTPEVVDEGSNIEELSIEDVMMQEAMSCHENLTVPTNNVTESRHLDAEIENEANKRIEQFDQLIEGLQFEEREITPEHLQAVSEKLAEIQNVSFGHDLRIFSEAERESTLGESGSAQGEADLSPPSTNAEAVHKGSEEVITNAVSEKENIQELSIEDVMMQEALSSQENLTVPTNSVTESKHLDAEVEGEADKRIEQFDQLIESLRFEEREITPEHLQAVSEKLAEIQNASFGHDLRIFSEAEKNPNHVESGSSQEIADQPLSSSSVENVHKGTKENIINTISEKENIALELDNAIKQFAKSVDNSMSEKTVQDFDVEVQIERPMQVQYVDAKVEPPNSHTDFPGPKTPLNVVEASPLLTGAGLAAVGASGAATVAATASISGVGAAAAVAGGVIASAKYLEKESTSQADELKEDEARDHDTSKSVSHTTAPEEAPVSVGTKTEEESPDHVSVTESEHKLASAQMPESPLESISAKETAESTLSSAPEIMFSETVKPGSAEVSEPDTSHSQASAEICDSVPVTESVHDLASVQVPESQVESISAVEKPENLSQVDAGIASDSQAVTGAIPEETVVVKSPEVGLSDTSPVQALDTASVTETASEQISSPADAVVTSSLSDSITQTVGDPEMKVSAEKVKSESKESECVASDTEAKFDSASIASANLTSVSTADTEKTKVDHEINIPGNEEKIVPGVAEVASASVAAAASAAAALSISATTPTPPASTSTTTTTTPTTTAATDSVTPPPTKTSPKSTPAEPEKKSVPAAKPKPKLLGRKPLAKDKPKSTLAENAQARKVPHSRFGRMLTFGGLAAGLGAGTIAEMTRRTLGVNQGKGSGSLLDASPFLTEANAKRIVDTLCKVRGAALKLGQMLSIQDSALINPQVQKIFERVRQSADFMPAWQLEKAIREELGDEWKSKVAYFDDKPFAAASIGQVHLVKLHDGRSAAMKIQYPGVAAGIESDINNLISTLKVANIIPEGLYVDSVIEVAKRELGWECDYKREASCTEEYRQLIRPYPEFYVPEIVPELCTAQIFTSELIEGVPVDKCIDMDQDTRNYIGEKIIRLCLLELFRFGFMQTDPNWSNFFYNADTEQLALLDFGACRSYDKSFVDKYIHIIHGAASKDRGKILQYSQELGFLTGHEAKVMVDAHIDAIMILGEAFQDDEPFPFGSQDTTHRIQHLVPVMLSHRMCAPPEESYSLHRKMSGVFLLCAKLNAVVNCKPLFEEVFEEYKFGGTWKEFHKTLGI
ncbi:uro-adherence factor A [Macrobrachium rosenbergii]|uniref:uro-adherence factor A n=1 Tax=Macrobrachium rosenbergii TaxID=79674 RepID=UPI0034D7503B